MFQQTDDEEISNNNLLTTIPRLNEDWSLVFEIRPTMYFNTFKQFFNMRRNGEDFHPAFYMMSSETWRVHFTGPSSVDLSNTAAVDQWTKIEYVQEKRGDTHFIVIYMNGVQIYNEENTHWTTRLAAENVEVYTNLNQGPQPGFIRGLTVQNRVLENNQPQSRVASKEL